MRYLILGLVLVFAAFRISRRMRGAGRPPGRIVKLQLHLHGDAALVAEREVRERTRGRVFRIGTVIILLAVAAAIVIPTLHHSSKSAERVGVVGTMPAPMRETIVALGPRLGTTVQVTAEPDLSAAEHELESGRIDVAVVDARRLIVKTAPGSGASSTTALLAQALSSSVSLQAALQASGLSPQRAAALAHPPPLPVSSLHPARNQTGHAISVYGLILLFVLLSQYGTWILLGVVEEKSSRVIEVLLAAVKPRQLLAGKVLGIGIVALFQAVLIVAVVLGLGAAVGSDLLRGSNPTNVLATVAWLFLGYAFYCWVYAAAGSLATRQEHVQTIAFPLQLPILLGYIASLTAVSSGSASTFVRVLAYLPPTAPFAMPVLVALGQVSWWQFTVAVALSLLGTAAVARLAVTIYLRAILQTGQRVRFREVIRRVRAVGASTS
ncbi:MAG: ABC transporter permease [Jatrophihabitantaceae bacterium]